MAAEQYRLLALQVENAAAKVQKGALVVTVTAPDAGVGKTTTSLNLGLTLARRGERRVLVIECDLWKPEYESLLVLSGTPTRLGDLLKEDVRAPLNRSVVSLWGAGLDLIPGGLGPGDGDLVTSDRMEMLVREARKTYDCVILDSPPFTLASGRALAQMADGVLIVVGAGQSHKREVARVLETVGPEKTLGLILNKVKKTQFEHSTYTSYSYRAGRKPDKR